MPKNGCSHLPKGITKYIYISLSDELPKISQRDAFLSALMKTSEAIELDFDTVHKCAEHPLTDSHFWVIGVKEK